MCVIAKTGWTKIKFQPTIFAPIILRHIFFALQRNIVTVNISKTFIAHPLTQLEKNWASRQFQNYWLRCWWRSIEATLNSVRKKNNAVIIYLSYRISTQKMVQCARKFVFCLLYSVLAFVGKLICEHGKRKILRKDGDSRIVRVCRARKKFAVIRQTKKNWFLRVPLVHTHETHPLAFTHRNFWLERHLPWSADRKIRHSKIDELR